MRRRRTASGAFLNARTNGPAHKGVILSGAKDLLLPGCPRSRVSDMESQTQENHQLFDPLKAA
jgi:hypothetical protein